MPKTKIKPEELIHIATTTKGRKVLFCPRTKHCFFDDEDKEPIWGGVSGLSERLKTSHQELALTQMGIKLGFRKFI